MTNSTDYQKGYAAGSERVQQLKSRVAELEYLEESARKAVLDQKERVYMAALTLVLEHCRGWSVAGKAITDAKGYCDLADIFCTHSIEFIRGQK